MKKPHDIDEPQVLAEVGGLVDEAGISLAIYGETLEPSVITGLLKVTPTNSHRRGDRRGPRFSLYSQGAWFLSARCAAPVEPDATLMALLASVPDDEALWKQLAGSYDLQLRIGVHYTGWNKGFDLAPTTLQRLARMHVRLVLDLYAYGEDDGSEGANHGSGV